MIILYVITGVVIGAALFASIFYMGYHAGKRDYEYEEL